MINVITLFSGYDSQCLALNRLGVGYELIKWCETQKKTGAPYAKKSGAPCAYSSGKGRGVGCSLLGGLPRLPRSFVVGQPFLIHSSTSARLKRDVFTYPLVYAL